MMSDARTGKMSHFQIVEAKGKSYTSRGRHGGRNAFEGTVGRSKGREFFQEKTGQARL